MGRGSLPGVSSRPRISQRNLHAVRRRSQRIPLGACRRRRVRPRPRPPLRRGRHSGVRRARGVARYRCRAADGRDGPVGLGQVDADAHARRPGRPTVGEVVDRGHRDHASGRRAADEAAPRPHRLHLPVLQPAADAHGARRTSCCRCPSPAGRSTRTGRGAHRQGRARRRLTHRPSELSGGQQQRVAIARALVSRPTVLFADEPTGNLDSTTSAEILGFCASRSTSFGQTTVMVTHDPQAAAIADRVLFLADGQIVRDVAALDASARGRSRRMEELGAR